MPSETGGGIRRMVMCRSAKICAAPAMGVQHSETAANLFYDGPQTIVQTKSMRLESVEPVFETDSALRGCGSWRRHCGAVVWRFFRI